MKINTMKLKLTALLLVLYTGLYAQNKIVLTAPRLDTSSLSNRINLKANTNLNNVNGVLSSTYGGAGSVNGILKANGSGVVSPVIASDITTLISGTYLPLSGGTLTGALNITNANINLSNAYFLAGKLVSGTNVTLIGMNGSDKVSIDPNGYGVVVGNTLSLGGALNGTSAAFSGAGSFGGNVGIGLATATSNLEIFNNSIGGNIRLTRDAGVQRGLLEFGRNNSGSFQYAASIIAESDAGGGNNGVIRLTTSNGSGVQADRVTVNSTALTSLVPISGTSAAFSGNINQGGGTASNTAGFTNNLYIESNIPSITLSNTGSNTGKYTIGVTEGSWGLWNNTTSAYEIKVDPLGSGLINFGRGINGTSAAFSGAGSFGGNVGIGTTSPSAILHTLTSSAIGGIIATTSATTLFTEYRVNTSTLVGYIGNGNGIVTGGGNTNFGIRSENDLLFASSGNNERMRLTSGGNLLIKTTTESPNNEALQVAGSGLFTGNILTNGEFRVNPASGDGIVRMYVNSTEHAAMRANSTKWYLEVGGTERLGVDRSTGAITASSSVTANSFVKSGGTSAQFLKADGSVDGSTYLTSAGAVTSIAGTTNQITVSASTGAVTVSLPSAVTISGAMNASSFFETSDLRKKDIVSVTKQADGIDFVGFKWKKELNLDNRKHLGVIAQQVEKVIPDAVTTDEKGYKSVNYTEVLIYKLEQLTKKVEELEKKLKTKKLKN